MPEWVRPRLAEVHVRAGAVVENAARRILGERPHSWSVRRILFEKNCCLSFYILELSIDSEKPVLHPLVALDVGHPAELWSLLEEEDTVVNEPLNLLLWV